MNLDDILNAVLAVTTGQSISDVEGLSLEQTILFSNHRITL